MEKLPGGGHNEFSWQRWRDCRGVAGSRQDVRNIPLTKMFSYAVYSILVQCTGTCMT